MTLLEHYARTVVDTLRYDGVPTLLWKIVKAALSPVGQMGFELLFEKDLTRPIEPIRARVPVEVRELGLSELDGIMSLIFRGRWLGPAPSERPADRAAWPPMMKDLYERYAARLRRGEKCFVATIGEEVVHVNWTCFKWCEAAAGYPLLLQPGEIYTTDGLTATDWRGKRIHEEVLNEMLRAAQRRGYRLAYTMAELGTRRSRPGLRRVGWRVRGTLLYFTPRFLFRAFIVRFGGNIDPLLRLKRGSAGARAADAAEG